MSQKINVLEGFAAGLRPIPLVKVSDWADQFRFLSSESAAEPGLWRTSRTPYLRAIMDDLSPNSPVSEVIVSKGVQLGFTESGLNAVGCFIDVAPCPIMYVMPTLDMSKAISETRVEPMIDNSPSLKRRIRPAKSKDSGNTKLVKRFPGGVLVLSGANSASSLRSRPVKLLVLDEVDAYPLNVDNEGSPISLAEKRTSTFGTKKKIYKLSTPTVEGQSVIEAEWDKTDQRKYLVPCPDCGGMQELKFDRLRWEAGAYHTARYQCEHCDTLIEERFKSAMLAGGSWTVTKPEQLTPTKKGYHINSLYSPLGWLSWAEIAEQWEKAQGDDNLLRVFTNTILGQTWKEKGEAPEWENVYNRRETYALNTVANDVALITAGVDIQKDRIELEVVGWCPGKRSYSIDYRVLPGQTEKEEVWEKLAEVVGETWTREDGLVIPLRMMAIDTGYNTQHVYNFCRRFDPTRVMAIKGQDNQATMIASPSQVETNWNGKKTGNILLWKVGVSIIKSEVYGWLRLNKNEEGVPPNGFCHFPQYEPGYFKGLTCERMEYRIVNGYRRYQWVKKSGDRNEPLDCRVYARAAAAVVGIDRFQDEHWTKLLETYGQRSTPKKEEKTKPRSSFWDRH